MFLGFGAIAIGVLLALGSLALLVTQEDDGGTAAAADEPTAVATVEPSPTAPPVAETSMPTGTSEPTAAPTLVLTQTPTPSPTSEPTPVTFSEADVTRFLDGLGAAGDARDVDSLMAWLHPAVVERYGEAACRGYFETVTLALNVEVLELMEPGPWDWVTDDGEGGRFEDALTIEISRLVGSQTFVQLLHLVPLDGELRWLTDCGEPLPG